MKQEVIEQIEKKKIIAILRGIAADRIGPVCKALLDGGVTVAEITFDQSDPSQFAQTAQAISTARQMVGDAMVIGAGTVLTVEQAKLAQQAGAAFFVTPNTKEEMIRFANAHDIATVIGAMTATECQQAHEWGADFVKLFPSETMGAAYLKALRAPLNHLRFIAVGGIDENNMKAICRQVRPAWALAPIWSARNSQKKKTMRKLQGARVCFVRRRREINEKDCLLR